MSGFAVPSHIRDRAQRFARRGWHVFPIRRDTGGRWPTLSDPAHPRHQATKSIPRIQRMDWEAAWVGLRPEPSRLVVVDLDNKNGKHGVSALEDFLDGRELPRAPWQKTPHGRHMFFRRRHHGRFRVGTNGVDLIGKGGVTIDGPGYNWIVTPWQLRPPVLPDYLDEIVMRGWPRLAS